MCVVGVFCGIGVEVERENFKGGRWIQRGQRRPAGGRFFFIFFFIFLGLFWIFFLGPFGCLLVGLLRQSAWPGPPRTCDLASGEVAIGRVIYAYSDFLARCTVQSTPYVKEIEFLAINITRD